MPWTGSAGSKTYSRTDGTRSGSQTWQEADGAGVDIIATDHDTHDQDMADAISATLLKDGGNTATANLPMGGFRHTNAGAAVARSDYARFSDHQDGKGIYCPTVGGTGNAITLTTGYSVGAYTAGQRFAFIVGTTNTGATTVNVDSNGSKSIVRSDGSNTALSAGDLVAGMMAETVYDGARFHLMSTQVASAASGDVLARIVKVGSVAIWPMTTVPTGWLEADGSAVSRTTYAELFAVYGTAYGPGDSSTTFNLPNYKDYFIRGYDAAGTDASSRTDRGDGTTGASVGTKQAGGVESHLHAQTAQQPTFTYGTNETSDTGGGFSAVTGIQASGLSNTLTPTADATPGDTALTGGTETRPKNVTAKFIILALPAAASASTLGVNGFLYTWDTGTSDADPGSGKLRINNATASSATELYISETGANSESLAAVLATWDDSTSTIKGDLYIYKVGNLGTYRYFQITGTLTDSGDYNKFSLTYVGANGSLANGDNVSVLYIPRGAKGDTGATGSTGSAGQDGLPAGLRYLFDSSTTMADPGTGDVRLNNATLASVTACAISDLTAFTGNPDASAVILTWDDSSNSANRGTVTFKKASAPENFAQYIISGASTDNSGWTQLALTHVASSGSFSAADALAIEFSRTGDKGTDGLGAGDVTAAAAFATDNVVIRSDGTGKGVQFTGISVDDSNNMSGVVALAATTIELGHASDTTISRTGAGAIAVEGVGVALNSTSLAHTAASIELGHATDTTLSRSSAGVLAVEGVTVSLNSTSAAHTAGTIELGAASDTTLARVSAGVMSVEGETVHTNSTSRTVTAAGIELGHATDTTLSRSAAGVLAVEGVIVKMVGVDEWFIPAYCFAPRTSNGCAALATFESSTNKVNLPYLAFDATTQEFAQVIINRMPKSWNEGTITAIPQWMHPSTTTNFGVVWGVSAVALSDDDAADTAFGTAQTSTDTGGTTSDLYHGPATSAITIGNTPAEGDTVIIQVSRNPSDGSDTMAVDAYFLGLLIRVTSNAANDA